MHGLSKLNEVSVRPKPIERQSVPTCQRVFCEETLAALRVHPGLDQNVPTDKACQWTFFCFIIFNSIKDKVCRKSLANIMMMISDAHAFEMNRSHANILSNIFFKNYCIEVTPRSSKEPKKKVLKFSA